MEPPERRERAQRFLKDTLAAGPKPVSMVEAAAAKAHVDPTSLEQARADLGIVTSRSNMPGACRRCSGACPAERPRSASGVKLGRVLINRPVVCAFGQTGHRADIAE